MKEQNSYSFIYFFYAHIQSRIRSVSIGIIHSTYTTSAIQHIMTSMDKKFHNGKTDLGSAFFGEVGLGPDMPLLPVTRNGEFKLCLILHNYDKSEMTCSAAFKAYYKYMLCW